MTRRRKRKPKEPFRSLYEERIGNWLESNGISYEYEAYSYEYEEPLRKNRAACSACGSTDLVRTGWYTPDFFVGDNLVIEAKGRFTAADRRKMKPVKATVPELADKLVIMLMSNNKLAKNSHTRYSDWCEKEGFDYVIGTELKEEWL